jgi:hypothetical protein
VFGGRWKTLDSPFPAEMANPAENCQTTKLWIRFPMDEDQTPTSLNSIGTRFPVEFFPELFALGSKSGKSFPETEEEMHILDQTL